jgi:ATP-dependent Clp protease ATP-binding subunit ClpC
METDMFEPHSLRARRVVFFARHLAGYSGSDGIRTEHLILAMIYEDQNRLDEAMEGYLPDFKGSWLEPTPMWTAFFAPEVAARLIQDFKTLIGTGEPLPSHIDMPLAIEAKRTLVAAHKLAGAKLVMPLHLLAAALGEAESQSNALLREAGVEIETVLKAIQ